MPAISREHPVMGRNPFHLEPQYVIRGPNMGHAVIVHRGTNIPIPSDEPIFLLRASDAASIPALRAYADQLEPRARGGALKLAEMFLAYRQVSREDDTPQSSILWLPPK